MKERKRKKGRKEEWKEGRKKKWTEGRKKKWKEGRKEEKVEGKKKETDPRLRFSYSMGHGLELVSFMERKTKDN